MKRISIRAILLWLTLLLSLGPLLLLLSFGVQIAGNEMERAATDRLIESVRDAMSAIQEIKALADKGAISPADAHEAVRRHLNRMGIGQYGVVWAMDSKGVLTADPNHVGESIAKYDWVQEMIRRKEGVTRYTWYETPGAAGTRKAVAYAYLKDWDWIVASSSPLAEFRAPVVRLRLWGAIGGLLAALLGLLLGLRITRMIARPLRAMVAGAGEMAQGRLGTTLTVDGPVEIRQLGEAFLAMRAALCSVLDQVALAARHVHESGQALKAAAGETALASGDIARAIAEVAAASAEQTQATKSAYNSVYDLDESITSLVSATDRQTDLLERLAARSVEIVRSARQVADQAEVVGGATDDAAHAAEEGHGVVREAIQSMHDVRRQLNESARVALQLRRQSAEISGMVDLILNFSGQTNLLALNAAVEAAKAGEHGRGFKVVAAEVRKLADSSGKAAARIEELVRAINGGADETARAVEQGVSGVNGAVQMAEEAGASLDRIAHSVTQAHMQASRISDFSQQALQSADSISQEASDIAQLATANRARAADMAQDSSAMAALTAEVLAQATANADSSQSVGAASEEVAAGASGLSEQARSLVQTAAELAALLARFEL